jgi:hypothetical protein
LTLTAIRRACLLAGGIACGLASAWGTATASPYSEVASGFDEDDPFDLHVRIDYDVAVRRAAIKREVVGFPGTLPGDPMPIAKDLVFRGIRHTVTPRFDLGVFTDLAVTAALPIVVSDRRTLSFDQRATPCVFPGGGDAPTCINADNSTAVRDGLLPATGFDARDPTGPGFTDPDDATIFRGPGRSGLDQLHLGLVWAPMNQERDPTKPTWKIGTEMRLAVGRTMKLDRRDPSRETGVGRGLHEVRAWTSMARRTSWAEPYMEMWWMATVGERSDSQFIRPGFGQTRVAPQQRAGTIFGFEAVAWENPAEGQRISLDFGARLEAHFEGRAYTEMWEVFQYAGDATAGGPLVLRAAPRSGAPHHLHRRRQVRRHRPIELRGHPGHRRGQPAARPTDRHRRAQVPGRRGDGVHRPHRRARAVLVRV